MKKTIFCQDQVFWYLKRPDDHCLRDNLEVDVAIIGGGMAGLSAAQAFLAQGKKVVLLEAYYCGAGASGKSSGFITPNAELSLSDFIERYGDAGAKTIWQYIEHGVAHIKKNIEDFKIDCDYHIADSLEVANSPGTCKKIRTEYESLSKLGYKTSFVEKKELKSILGAEKYYGGVIYPDTFGINAYKYCQAMKDILKQQGALMYEETPVLTFTDHEVTTLHAKIKTDYIVVCADKFIPLFGVLPTQIYHAQNFLLVSQPLTDEEIKKIFPQKNYMVWDTDLLYTYFRLTQNRLLVGGGSLLYIYNKYTNHESAYIYHKLTHYMERKFPQLTLQFEQMWPGMIGISKDIAPICGRDEKIPSIFYIGACAGLPIAATLGHYAADHLLAGSDDLKDYFSPYRSFTINNGLQRIIGTKLAFALSNLVALK